jgi:hypothetical protein
MSHARPPHARPDLRPALERLETRENPSTWVTEGFDAVAAPALPADWARWSNDGQQQFITSPLAAASGPNSLASLGSTRTEARFWMPTALPADFGAAVSVRAVSSAPLELIARGQNLDTKRPSYLAAVVRNGGAVALVEERDGSRAVLGTARPQQPLPDTWLRVSLRPAGEWAGVQVQRADTGQYLTPTGTWQPEPADALRGRVTHRPAEGVVGVGRDTGGRGMAYLDDFAALAPAGLSESFDTTAVGGLPATWQRWANDQPDRARVTTARAVSPANGLAVEGGSLTQGRAWLGTAVPADVSASVSVFADNLIPAGVIARGSNLDTAAPTYYAVTVTRGLAVQLKRVGGGTEAVLGTVRSSAYVSGVWVRLTLVANGDRLRAVVYRADTQQWLGANGQWQGTPEAALEVTDATLRGSGFAGVERSRIAAGAVWFDDFEVRKAGSNAGPTVTVTASQPGTTFRDAVTFTATAAPATPVARVEFRLNGRLRSSQTDSPAGWELDTTTLTNGPHRLTVRAIDRDGTASTTALDFTVQNDGNTGRPPRPTGVRKYAHIRLAQLAYSGNPMGQYERDLARDSLDLIVPNPAYLPALEAAAAATPKVIYTNVSNLYLGLLTDWLAYADRTGANREAAFYHVTQPTAFTGASQSSVPVTQFWGVSRQAAAGTGPLTDLTGEARGTRPAGVEFAAAGQAVNVGWTDRFREINVALNRAAVGWAGRFEYVSEVNPDGTPKTWKPLPLLADGTAGFTADGRVTFDPPRDWKAAKLAGTAHHLHYVRVVTTAGTGPNARTLLGRDYVGAAGRPQGTIPAFDPAADRDGDGYLSDAEYATRRAGFDARFVHESRLFYPYYGQMRFVTNPTAVALHRWAADYHVRLLAAHPHADGFFVDNSNGKLPFAGTSVRESVVTFTEDMAGTIDAVVRAVPGRWVVANTAGSRAEGDPVAGAATAAYEEFVLRPNDVNWSGLQDVASLVGGRLNSDSPSPYVILDSHPGAASLSNERTKMGTLAYYYLLADPDQTFLMFFGGFAPASPWNRVFVRAATTDVGRPAGGMTEVATGADPQNAALTYKVYGREYGNAKVLFKPRSYAVGRGTGTTDDATATTHDLGGNYRQLYSDGSLGQVVTRVNLRNGEGVVLMRA